MTAGSPASAEPPTPTTPAVGGSEPRAPGGAGASSRGTPDHGTPDTPPNLADTVTRLRLATLRLAHGLRAPAAAHGLTPTRLAALAALAADGPLRVGELARRLGTSMPSVSRLLDLLTAADLVERRADPLDQRAALAALTDHGTGVVQAVRRESLDRLTRGLHGLDAAQLRALAEALPAVEQLAAHLSPGPLTDPAPPH